MVIYVTIFPGFRVHSYVEELVRMGKLEASEAEEHPSANIVLNAVGIEDTLILDMEYYEVQADDLFVLCSDGLFKDLSDANIESVLLSPDLTLDELSTRLIDTALEAGGSDNCTVVLVRADSGM